MATVTVVGLGPGDADLLTAGTIEAIAVDRPRLLRTARHPAARAVPDARTCDDVYESAESMVEVYPAIVERVVATAIEHGDVLYAVPGAPNVAERTVELLLADPRVTVTVLPALSFLDLTWARLGVDPLAEGVRVVDGHRFDREAAGERGPLVVCQCDQRDLLSDIKLALDDDQGPRVTVIQRLGLPDEAIFEVDWDDLDRSFEPDHLTSLYIPRLAAPIGGEVAALVDLMRQLRAGCPWDAEQTHESLIRYLIEETYELVDALRSGDPVDIEEELGDVLFQVVFHCQLGTEDGEYTLADVARTIREKLVARHPHVFGDVTFDSREQFLASWETSKQDEKGRESVMDGIASSLPVDLLIDKVLRKAASVDHPIPDEFQYQLDRLRAASQAADAAARAAAAELMAAVRSTGR